MTVCVATIGEGMVFGAADRMLTANDVQFTPAAPKVFQLTTSIALMVAGDMAIQAELVGALQQHISAVLGGMSDNPRWLTVKEVAGWYVELFTQLKVTEAERTLLRPLGLTCSTFLQQQGTLSQGLVEKIAREMLSHQLPGVSAIVAGLDDGGPHLYVVENGECTCRDLVGFAAIGSGANHANSYLMFSQHARRASAAVAVHRAFAAKKRSEVAPGVGTFTDLFLIGPALGTFNQIAPHLERKLENVYAKTARKHTEADRRAEAEINEFVESLANPDSRHAGQSIPEIEHREPSPPIDEERAPEATSGAAFASDIPGSTDATPADPSRSQD